MSRRRSQRSNSSSDVNDDVVSSVTVGDVRVGRFEMTSVVDAKASALVS